MATSVDVLITRWQQQNLSGFVSDMARAQRAAQNFEDTNDRLGRRKLFRFESEDISRRLTSLGAVGSGALALIGKSALDTRSSFESVEVGLEGSLGSFEAAQKKLEEIKNFAKEAPQFSFLDVSDGVRSLLQAQRSSEKVMEDVEGLGEALARAGKGSQELKRGTLAYSQILNKSRVQAEELLQLEEAGIPATRILRRELGLTADEVARIGDLKLDPNKALDALTRGLKKDFGGSIEAQSKTLAARSAAFIDAKDQFLDAAGKAIEPTALVGLEKATQLFEKLEEVADQSPGLIRTGAAITAAGLIASVAAGQYLKFQNIIKTTAAAKKALRSATVADNVAEKAKAITAGIESKAIGATADAAQTAAAAKGALAGATETAGAAAGKTTKQLGALARAQNFLKGGIGPQFNVGKGALALRGATGGSALVGGALGAAAGVGVSNDLKAQGYDETASNAAGIATGVGAAALAAFNPAAAALIGAAELIRYGVNENYNKLREREAELGSGAENTDIYGSDMQSRLQAAQKSGNRRAVADIYSEMSTKAREDGDNASAESYALQAMSQRRLAKQENVFGTDAYYVAGRKRQQEFESRNPVQTTSGPGAIINSADENPVQMPYGQPQLAAQNRGQTTRRDGVTKTLIEIESKPTAGDRLARAVRYNRMTPAMG